MRWIAAAVLTVGLAALLARRANAASSSAGTVFVPSAWLDFISNPDADAYALAEPDQRTTIIEDLFVSLDPSTYIPAAVDANTAARNVRAFLQTLIAAEGTNREADPYRVVFGFGHTLQDLSDHPYFTGEWKGRQFSYQRDGETLTAWTTAAGAYQFLKGTWAPLRDRLQLPDFGPASQDAAAIELIRERGALRDVQAGRFATAIHKVRPVWASLPGAGYGQPERSFTQLLAVYQAAGGTTESQA